MAILTDEPESLVGVLVEGQEEHRRQIGVGRRRRHRNSAAATGALLANDIARDTTHDK
jgi:hypothetical protein